MSRLQHVSVFTDGPTTVVETRSSGNGQTSTRTARRLCHPELAEELQRVAWAHGHGVHIDQIETGDVDGEPYAVWDRADHMTPAEADAVTAAALDQIDAWEASGHAWPFKRSEPGPTS